MKSPHGVLHGNMWIIFYGLLGIALAHQKVVGQMVLGVLTGN